MPAIAREVGQAAALVHGQRACCAAGFAELGARPRRDLPRFVVTCARSSSDHAASHGKY